MRGDRPVAQTIAEEVNKFTPHARGSTQRVTEATASGNALLRMRGIDRYESYKQKLRVFTRMRGDRPYISPWPSFLAGLPRMRIDLQKPAHFTLTNCLPCMRGSTPRRVRLAASSSVYPHARIDPA